MRYLTATTYAISKVNSLISPSSVQELIELAACADACEVEVRTLTSQIQDLLKTFETVEGTTAAEKIRELSIKLADETKDLVNCKNTLYCAFQVVGSGNVFREKLVSLPTKK